MLEHQTVLLEQAVDALVTDPDGLYIDGTYGRGGHSKLILHRLSPRGRLLVIDKDPVAVEQALRLGRKDGRVSVRHGSFARIKEYVAESGLTGTVMGVLLDLGVSSPQLDDAERGFSFIKDGPLDMRMNPQEGISAGQWLAGATEREIADVMYRYGEERYSRRIARAIVNERDKQPITTTMRLAEIIKQAHPAWEKNKHPATRAFQGIRIHINSELEELEQGLSQALDLLGAGGRMVVISFHSLEDRIVKHFMQKQARGDDYPLSVPVTSSQMNPRLKIIGKARKVSPAEVTENIRSRSAVMRVAEKI